jgi:hypothetical protein
VPATGLLQLDLFGHSTKNCVSRCKNPQNRMCPLTGIRGQHKTMHAAKRKEHTKILASNFLMLIYCRLKGALFNIKKLSKWRGDKAHPSYAGRARLHGPTESSIRFPSIPRAKHRDSSAAGSQRLVSTPSHIVSHISEHSRGCSPTHPRRCQETKTHNLPNALLKKKAPFSLLGKK